MTQRAYSSVYVFKNKIQTKHKITNETHQVFPFVYSWTSTVINVESEDRQIAEGN